MDGPTRPRLSLVLPAFNEEAGIRQAIAEADDALARLADDYEVLVIDDGSSDATAVIVRDEAGRRPHVHLLSHPRNQGYGAALRTGFAAARFPLVAFTDADCQFYLDDLNRLLPLTDCFPVVVGRREDRQDPWRRRFLSGGYNLLVRTLLGTRVRDCDCALKVFHREALASLLPECDGFFVNAEMLARARLGGLAVAEVGVRHRPRARGDSKVSLTEVPRTLRRLLPFWWSRVLFAGQRRPGDNAPGGAPSWAAVLVLLAVASVLFFSRLRSPLLEPQEPRYAEIPRQMLEQGSLAVPVLHGQPYLDKPPLLYWAVMASYRLFGAHDWAARLVPGLVGVALVLVTYLWGARALGRRAGLAGALVLCLSAEFIYRIRMLTMDGLLCLWVTAALASLHAAISGARLRWRWWLAGAMACGLGVLTKGPVALALVVVPVLAVGFLEPRGARPRWRHWLLFLGVLAAVAGPWFAVVAMREAGFLSYFFWTHNVLRFAAPFDHAKPVWFYLPGLLLGMLPWTLLAPGMVAALARRSRRAAARRPVGLGFLLLAGLWGLVFFSASGCKRPGYVLPAMPPLALALGWHLDQLVPRFRAAAGEWAAWWAWRSRTAWRATLLVLMVGGGAAAFAGGRQMIRPTTAMLLVSAALAGMGLVAVRRHALSWGACALATFAVLSLTILELHAAYGRQFALRGQVRSDRELTRQPGLTVVCYPQRWDSVSFYLPQADVRVYSTDQRPQMAHDVRSRERTLVLVKSGVHLQELLDALPPSVEFVPRGRPGMVTAGWVRPRTVASDVRFASLVECGDSSPLLFFEQEERKRR